MEEFWILGNLGMFYKYGLYPFNSRLNKENDENDYKPWNFIEFLGAPHFQTAFSWLNFGFSNVMSYL